MNKTGDSQSAQAKTVAEAVAREMKKGLRPLSGEDVAAELAAPDGAEGGEPKKDPEKKSHPLGALVAEAHLDFNEIKDWRDANGLPPKTCLDVYRAIGLWSDDPAPAEKGPINRYREASGLAVIPQMQIGMAYHTWKKLSEFLAGVWMSWPLAISADGAIIVRPGWSAQPYNYPRSSLPSRIKAALKNDLDNYGPFVDDSLSGIQDEGTVRFYAREAVADDAPKKG